MGRNKPQRVSGGGGGGRSNSTSSTSTVSKDLRSLDLYLEKQHLQRKPTAKDGSCLFRAVSEQVFLTQFHHEKVRMQCVKYIRDHQEEFQNFVTMPLEEYLTKLTRELWGGEMELVVLSKLYTRTIIVYMYSEQSRTITDKKIHPEERMEATKNPILLAYSDGNHYDSVYSTERMQHISMCQGILYTMLFEGVMKDAIPTVCKRRLDSVTEQDLTITRKRDVDKPKPIQLLANHYSTEVMRAMGSQVYHNAELQAHQNERATIERFDRQVATSIQFQVGDRCRFKLPDSKTQDGEISALYSAEDCHTVYVYDANEEWVIPSKVISLNHPSPGSRNSSQQNQPNRFKNRQGNSRSDDTYNRHDSHPSLKPPSSHPEAWPTPTTTIRVQPTKPSPTNDSKLSTGAAKPMVSSQVQSRQSSDKRGGHDKDKDQKVANPPVAITPASRPKQGTSSVSKMAAPQVQNAKVTAPSKNTLDNKASSKTPLQDAPRKPPGLNKPAVQQPRPAKVNGGPGGSLTSEDSNYSSSSDDSGERGEQTNTTSTPPAPQPQPPPQSLPARQGTGKPSKQYNGQPEVAPGWQGEPAYVTGHPNDNEKKAKNPRAPATTNQRHKSTADKQFQQRGRDSPYLVPQIPRDPSSQPEDDWPGFEPLKEVSSPDPASSTLLAAMRSPPRLHTMPPFSVPGDPTMVSVAPGTFKQMPLPPTFFAPFNAFPMMLSDPPGGNRDIQAPQGYIPATNAPAGYQDRPPVFPYIVHRTPSGTLINRAQPHGEPQKTMSAPNMRSSQGYPVYSSPAADVTTHREPEPVMPPLPPPVRPDVATQTTAPPVMLSTFTQVEKDEVESLSMTTYTQTPVKTYSSVGVEASVPTESISVQASTIMRSCETQTASKVAFLSELLPPSMEDEPSSDEKIKFAVQYAIQCLEVYANKDDTDQDAVAILENMKDFEENVLTTCLEDMHSSPVSLDPSQQDFLQSFAGSREFYASQLHQSTMEKGFFNRINPNDNLDQHQREMMFRQEEMLRQQGNSDPRHESPPLTGEPSPFTESSSSSLQGNEGNTEHRLSHPGGFPLPPFPMAQYPHHPMMQMQRPFMMMPYMSPFFPHQMPPHQMPPYSMMPPQQLISPNMMNPHSPLSSTPHPLREQESSESGKNSTPDNEIMSNDEVVANHQELKNTEDNSHPARIQLVAPSAFTVPSSVSYQEPSTVVSSEVTVQNSDTLKDSRSTPTNIPEFKDSPPPTPFEAKNPYDAVTIMEDNRSAVHSPAVDNNPPTVSVPNENTEGLLPTPLLDESQNLPCRGKPVDQKLPQQRFPKNNPQRQRPRQNRSSNKQTTQEPQSESLKSGKGQERPHKDRRSSKEPTDDVDKGNPRKSNSRQPRNKGVTGNKKGAEGQATRQQRPANGGASNSSTQSQSGRSRGGGRKQDASSQVPSNQSGRRQDASGQVPSHPSGRRQDASSQVPSNPSGRRQDASGQVPSNQSGRRQYPSGQAPSNQSGRSPGEPTRSASFLDYSEKHHRGIPCTVHQPRAFHGGFPSPNQIEGTEYENEGEYSHPTPAVNKRWKFTELSPSDTPSFTLRRDLLKWDRNDAWPKWDAEHTKAGYSETIEDPFPTFPTFQDHWDSDIGDMNVSLTVDQDCNVPAQPYTYFDNRMYGVAHAQCVSESKPGKNSSKRSDSECVVQAVKLPK